MRQEDRNSLFLLGRLNFKINIRSKWHKLDQSILVDDNEGDLIVNYRYAKQEVIKQLKAFLYMYQPLSSEVQMYNIQKKSHFKTYLQREKLKKGIKILNIFNEGFQ